MSITFCKKVKVLIVNELDETHCWPTIITEFVDKV